MDDELRKTVREVIETVTCLPPSAWTMDTSIALGGIVHTLRAALAKNANAAPSKAKPVAVAHMGGMEHGPVEIRVTPYGFDTLRNGRTNLYTLSALKAKNTSAAPQDHDAKDAARWRFLTQQMDESEVDYLYCFDASDWAGRVDAAMQQEKKP